MVMVTASALTGSPLAESGSNGARKGMIPSFEIACRSLGAPVSDCSPAPIVERREPISTTLGWGQAMLPTTRLPPMLSPNLNLRKVMKKDVGECLKLRLATVFVSFPAYFLSSFLPYKVSRRQKNAGRKVFQFFTGKKILRRLLL